MEDPRQVAVREVVGKIGRLVRVEVGVGDDGGGVGRGGVGRLGIGRGGDDGRSAGIGRW